MQLIVPVLIVLMIANYIGWPIFIALVFLIGGGIVIAVMATKEKPLANRVSNAPRSIAIHIKRAASLESNKHLPSSQTNMPRPQKAMKSGLQIASGLIIKEVHLAKILAGQKTWEMRSRNTTKRETVALIKSGSKQVYAIADIVDSRGPLSKSAMLENQIFHQMSPERLDDPEVLKYRFAWVLRNVRILRNPVSYRSKSGQVIFATIESDIASAIAAEL